MDVYKLLVVGGPKTGKSSIIKGFLNSELNNEAFQKQPSSGPKAQNGQVNGNSQMDFVLKIMTIGGKKVRVQLWDMAGSTDPATTFAPLFIRNAVGCIIVAKSDNQKSLEEIGKWKQQFDTLTQLPKSMPLPSALFINHFSTEMIESSLYVSEELAQQSEQLQEELSLTQVSHVNASSQEGIIEGFEVFIKNILEDQERNRRNDDLIDDIWDESIKIRSQHHHHKSHRPNSKQPNNPRAQQLNQNGKTEGGSGPSSGGSSSYEQSHYYSQDKRRRNQCKC